MTVSTTTNIINYTGDGFSLTYTYPFAMQPGNTASVLVFQTDTSGNITQLTQPTQYTVVINPAIAPNPTAIGGTVTLAVAPAVGTIITIRRTMALTQTTSLANQGTQYQPVVEGMDDYQAMLVQQLFELLGRNITVAASDPRPAALPPVAQRANLAMGFDSSGNPIAFSTAPAGVISSAMAPFVGAASITAAKLLLGYGSMANENIGALGKGIADDGAGNARVYHVVTPVSTNQSPASANHMNDYVASGTLVFTLPKLTTVFNGYELWVFCISGTSTLSPNAADNFPSAAGGASITLLAGQWARLIGDGISAWQIAMGRFAGVGSTQTRQTFTSGSGTYTTPAGCRRIFARYVGGGGASQGGGVTGTDTTFNSVTAKAGGNAGSGLGGAGGTGGAGAASLRIPGLSGTDATTAGAATGGPQVSTPLGNYGSGARGATGNPSIAGGGSAEYVELIINNPAASYTYSVGVAGTTAGGTGSANGGTGVLIVDEYY